MKHAKLTAIGLSFMLIIGTAWSLNVPQHTKFDTHVRYVQYNAQDVVQLDCVAGIASHIALDEKELYQTHVFGDAKAWSFIQEGHHYFIKPIQNQADTNLTIVTNKRTYYFRLNYHASADVPVVYGLRFIYPENIDERLHFERDHQSLDVAAMNWAYTASGDFELMPQHVWDDQTFTYFAFPENKDVPGIYLVDSNKQESIVNRHQTGPGNSVVAMHKTHPTWILRLGAKALYVHNEAYNPIGRHNDSGTISTKLERVLRSAN